MSNSNCKNTQKTLRVTVHVRSDVQLLVTIAGAGRRSDGSEGSSWSARVSELASRMEYVIRSHLPRFSRAEWSAIFDANDRGPLPECEPDAIKAMLWTNLNDSPALAGKWQVDTAAIVARLQSLTPVESIAVGEAARYVADNGDQPLNARMDKLGIA